MSAITISLAGPPELVLRQAGARAVQTLGEGVAFGQMGVEQPCDRAQDVIERFSRARSFVCRIFSARTRPGGEAAERDAEPAEQDKLESRNLAGKVEAKRGQPDRDQKHQAQRIRGAKMLAQQQERVHERPRGKRIAGPAIALRG